MNSAKAAATILYIDDDQDLADSYSRMLERAGYRVWRAADGEEGISIARKEAPDAILLDWMMPGKNGFETCMELRQIQSLHNVPIIVLTSFGQNIPYVHTPGGPAAALQIQDCLEKPVEINILLNRLGNILGKYSPKDGVR
jgi:DNA-binding response OmpR family regulator